MLHNFGRATKATAAVLRETSYSPGWSYSVPPHAGRADLDSDVDLLVTLDESLPASTGDLLEMAGEAENW